MRKRLVEAEAEQQVDDHVLQEDDRRARGPSNIFISASIEQRDERLDVLVGQRRAPASSGVEQALVGQEPAERARSCRARSTAFAYLCAYGMHGIEA